MWIRYPQERVVNYDCSGSIDEEEFKLGFEEKE